MTNRGFTLIETLIAILVLMMAIVGPLTLAAKGLQATLVAKDQDTAFYMAQDAVEYVRWVRDTNKLKGKLWLAGLDGTSNTFSTVDGLNGDCVSSTGAQKCTVDSLSNSIASCGASGAACSTISYNSNLNQFTYGSGAGIAASIFTRTVSIATPVGINDCTAAAGHGCEAIVTATVTWFDQGSLQRVVTVREDIFDWQ